MKPHAFDWFLCCGFVACSKCGLVRLGNDRSRQAVRAACPGRES